MKQNHCPLSQNLRMAAAALTATSIMASKVFRPVIRAGVAAAVILAALIAAVVTGKKIADRRRSPWEKFTGTCAGCVRFEKPSGASAFNIPVSSV